MTSSAAHQVESSDDSSDKYVGGCPITVIPSGARELATLIKVHTSLSLVHIAPSHGIPFRNFSFRTLSTSYKSGSSLLALSQVQVLSSTMNPPDLLKSHASDFD